MRPAGTVVPRTEGMKRRPARKSSAAMAALLAFLAAPNAHACEKQGPVGLPKAPSPLVLLLRDPAVHAELQLTAEQVQAIDRLVGPVDGPLWRLRDATQPEAAEKIEQLIARVDGRLPEILDADQKRRLDQIVFQARGPGALVLPATAERLRLSDEQVERIAALLNDFRKEGEDFEKGVAGKPAGKRAAETAKLQAAQRRRLFAAFTEPQKKALLDLTGKPFDFSKSRRRFARAPEFRGVDPWLNSGPLRLAELRGRVVVLHFWTFESADGVRNLAACNDWHEKYSEKGLAVVGAYTPETDRRPDPQLLRRQVKERALRYPVAVDGARETWTAWANHTCPSVYLIDKQGYVRYWWYGRLDLQGAEGDKVLRERIKELLAEND